MFLFFYLGFPCGSDGKESTCNAGDLGSSPGLVRSPGEGNGNTLQHSCLGTLLERGAWRATVHGAVKSQARLRGKHCHLSKGTLMDVSPCRHRSQGQSLSGCWVSSIHTWASASWYSRAWFLVHWTELSRTPSSELRLPWMWLNKTWKMALDYSP